MRRDRQEMPPSPSKSGSEESLRHLEDLEARREQLGRSMTARLRLS